MKVYGKSDVGMVRTENQDCFGIYELLPGVTLCVICDGMGGNAGGSFASRLCIDTFADMMRETLIPDSPEAEPDLGERNVREALRASVNAANDAVFLKASESEGKLTGMGTTLVALLATDFGAAWSVNVGDSRLYRVFPDHLERLTKDHSYVQQLVDYGTLTDEEAKNSPHKNIITRAVGTEPAVECDIQSVDLSPEQGYDGIFMLCTDGFYGQVEEADIIKAVYGPAGSLEEIAYNLVELSKNMGGQDNITVILAETD